MTTATETEQVYRPLVDGWITESRGGARPRRSTWMSAIGHPCLRRIVWDRRHWEDIPPFGPDTVRRLESGVATERNLMLYLQHEIGCVVTRVGEAVAMAPNVSGKIDGFIALPGNQRHPELFEVKSLSPYKFEQIHSLDDFDRFPYYRTYKAQGQSYMSGTGERSMRWFVCARGDHLGFREFVQEHSETFAALLRDRAEQVESHIARDADPPIDSDIWIGQEACDWCHWRRRCWPAPTAGEETPVIQDEEAAWRLNRIAELEAAGKEWEKLKKWRAARFADVEGKAICGQWLLSRGKPFQVRQAKSVKELPPEWVETVERAGRLTVRMLEE